MLSLFFLFSSEWRWLCFGECVSIICFTALLLRVILMIFFLHLILCVYHYHFSSLFVFFLSWLLFCVMLYVLVSVHFYYLLLIIWWRNVFGFCSFPLFIAYHLATKLIISTRKRAKLSIHKICMLRGNVTFRLGVARLLISAYIGLNIHLQLVKGYCEEHSPTFWPSLYLVPH